MAKNIDNSYDGTPDFTAGKTRTNPQATAHNVAKLYGIRKFGDCNFSPTWTYAYVAADDELTFTPTAGQATSGLRYWKYRIIDEDGVEVVGAMNVASPAAVVVDTSSLDPLKVWRIEFKSEVRTGGKSCIAEWNLEIPAGQGVANFSGSGQDV